MHWQTTLHYRVNSSIIIDKALKNVIWKPSMDETKSEGQNKNSDPPPPPHKKGEVNNRVVLPFVDTISSRLKRAFQDKDISVAFRSPNLVHPKDQIPREEKTSIV